ncbi:ShlB/FhaC/HecB family hemolysin secretion/activation protein [Sphingobium subterraneum]|uniref:Hemolysin activation/secretion protein n=1 Tax=Sphingobium subterraneum TaxID=627688 RepID=A0A841J062_9SPHN|nr:ShlB/FhaC/HecB family hemolysin secretion/activation protein [Sphingobium subterraneum]MBB6123980.1 hemolysin activation/secretion protein [Sphingobium subterraneum]
MVTLLSAATTLLALAQPSTAVLSPPMIRSGDQQAPVQPGDDASPTTHTSQSVAVEAADGAVPIRSIGFSGMDAPLAVADAARPYVGRKATRQTLAELAHAISRAYSRTGIALYTVAIPRQDFGSGHVRVLLAEGFVEDIAFPKGASSLVEAYAAPLRAERPLRRRTLERSLSLMRDIPGAQVDATLLRGDEPGGVRLSVTQERKHSDLAFGYDNRSQSGLGDGQLRASAKLYSLFQDGDRTELAVLTAGDLKHYRYAGLGHQMPIGAQGLVLGLSGSWLDTRLKGQPITGEAQTLGLSLSYPIIRGYKRNLTVSAGIDGLNSNAAYLGAVVSSDRIRAVRAAIGFAEAGPRSALSLAATVTQGLDIWGARGLPGFTDIRFTKIVANAQVDRALGKRLVGRLRLTGQYSDDRLGGNERIVIGGADFGRAFDTALLSGDRGAAGSFEMALRPSLPERFKGTEVYAFIDGARIRVLERLAQPTADYSFASAGGGLRMAYTPRASLSLEGARAIKWPFAGPDGSWRVNIAWSLKLRR